MNLEQQTFEEVLKMKNSDKFKCLSAKEKIGFFIISLITAFIFTDEYVAWRLSKVNLTLITYENY